MNHELELTERDVAALGSLRKYGIHVDGTQGPSAGGKYFLAEEAYSGRPWALIARAGAEDVNRAVAAAKLALSSGPWSECSATERGRLLRSLADVIGQNAERLAATEMRDNGKLAVDVVGQVRYLADYFHYYAGLADKIQGAVIPTERKGVFTFTKYEPKGVVALITPWNSPLSLASWKLAPALAAGCTAVCKPSEYTSASLLELAELFEKAGFPAGVLNVLTGFGPEVGEPLVSHPDVAHVAFTGGAIAGRRVYELAARGLKTVTLELGGKSPNIVFDDADIEKAVHGVASGILWSSGQSCSAGSRLLIQESIHDTFVEKLRQTFADYKMGDPAAPETGIAPIATRRQFAKIVDAIDVANTEGATCLYGGKVRQDLGAGTFVEPTIFINVNSKMRVAQEEIFGPVLAVLKFKDDDEAIAIANDSVYGLAAGVWTKSMRRALYLADRLKAGTIWINNFRGTSFTSPFGGYKQSGIGRESGSAAIFEYLQTKCVWISE